MGTGSLTPAGNPTPIGSKALVYDRPHMPAPGARVGTSYTLLERLGHGELGEVWRARHEKIGRECAIKFLKPAWPLAQEGVKAFLRDAKASGNLGQPSLVELLDQGEHEGTPYVVMPLLESEKLERVLQRRGALPVGVSLRLVELLAQGVAAAHEQRVFHLRIEAANVLVHRNPKGKMIPKLIDFGIAHLGAGPDQLISPLAYLAPEQLVGEPGEARADVWALATLLAHCVLGRLPFQSDSAHMLLSELDGCTAMAIEDVRAVDAAVASLVREGWARDKQKRPHAKVFSRKLHELALQRPGSLDALSSMIVVPESLAPGALQSIRPPKPPPRRT